MSDGTIRDRIVIFDDEAGNAEEWAGNLTELLGHRPMVCPPEDQLEALKVLEERRQRARAGGNEDVYEGTLFDRAGILVVDYDLFDLERTLDGNHLAYLARCFSSAGLIVGVNQDDTDRWFDLTLTDHPLAYTDVSVAAQFLFQPSLWTADDAVETFRPWVWPRLLQAEADLERCVEEVRGSDSEVTIAEMVGIGDDHIGLLNREVLLPVSPRNKNPSRPATLDELLDLTPMSSPFSKDHLSAAAMPRVQAARIRHWLESIVLVRQDILSDAPHLLADLPGVLADGDVDARRLEAAGLHKGHETAGLRFEQLKPFEGPGAPWLSRPTWWRPDYLSESDLDPLRDAPNDDGLVFCEDTSSFHRAEECRRFRSSVGGSLAQRWVRYVLDEGRPVADYEPAGRLLG